MNDLGPATSRPVWGGGGETEHCGTALEHTQIPLVTFCECCVHFAQNAAQTSFLVGASSTLKLETVAIRNVGVYLRVHTALQPQKNNIAIAGYDPDFIILFILFKKNGVI